GFSGAWDTNCIRTGPFVAGVHEAPLSVLTSGNTSKKLVTRKVSPVGRISVIPREGSVGLSRIIAPLGSVRLSESISVSYNGLLLDELRPVTRTWTGALARAYW